MLGAGLIAAVVVLLAGLLAVGSAAVAAHRMRSAADLAAIAGAMRRQSGGDASAACAVAERTARANGARGVQCRVTGAVVEVRVSRPVDLAGYLPGVPPAKAGARAGPAPEGPPEGQATMPAPLPAGSLAGAGLARRTRLARPTRGREPPRWM